ncbi:Gfo/Idh/MocA family protein [Peribacillus sp. NPDC101481]|uniref:Gfo/Idh/MocA family protein n=1 Tax=unclassified Peribacillus TaxID=2675266 RepID=UPI0019128A0E|nr:MULTISPECIES: Gfo/Idh/MocA family oxidoreductase [unclassified Peribacillus]MBK5446996.1 Gfo/Idh/MocA family oxidoreductase [Peribacillus sp. TH24]MBK5458249.1 Gfo/Idh/MocA family oxidoreductase [Peribacillus sp. TH27]MBK5482580.1 Gfo/Idh/MocA family oxidoreductase [Peribacillus sp. TH16]CAH0126135.1 Glucose-6-phosphate 3-dehydrogenase [Peribacillus sp. Bi134]
MEKIKVGVIGNGFIGPTHIEAIRRLGFVEVIGLAANGQEAAEKKAAELGISKAFGDYRDMLKDSEIQVVHNCTPNHLHFTINKEIMLAGKHVVSEKPLAMSSQESAELLALAKENKVVHGVNFNYRQYPIMKQLAAMIKNGELGKVNLVHGSYLQDWLLYETDFNWRLASDVGGKSRAIADIGSHWCDTVQYVTGKRITEVFADLATVIPVRKKQKHNGSTFGTEKEENKNYEDVSINTEDYASVLVRFEDGAKGVFTVSQVSAGRKNRLSFEINGSQHSAFWNQEEPEKLWIGHRERPNEILQADPALFLPEAKQAIHHPGGHNEGWPDAMKNMMLNYYSFIREGKDLLNEQVNFATFEDGHISMCITDAILESHEQQKWVKVQGRQEYL